jgi:WD40 repeat protein/serine/threonine protein kinase
MSDDDVEALLDLWEDARDRGELVAAEDLCKERPELISELMQRIQELREADHFLGTTDDVEWAQTVSRAANAEEEGGPVAPAVPGERYWDERFLAEGGLGRVFTARDAELPREVALKRLQPHLVSSREGRQRFMLEAEITARLEHPGVVPVYGLGIDRRGQPFYAMRLIRGTTMAEAIQRFHEADGTERDPGERGVALQILLRAFLAACQTIAYAHSRGVIHRDIKPANLMLGEYGETLVVDWGLAKPIGSPADEPDEAVRFRGLEQTALGQVKGSPAYMSPEQAAGRWTEVGPSSDVYALGATLYSLLTGVRPFDGKSLTEVLTRVRAGEFLPPRRVKPAVPRALEAICLKAMSLRSQARYAGALDLAADLERWLSGEPVRAWREPWPDRLRRWARRHRVLVASAGAALIVGMAVLAVTNGQLRSLTRRLDRSNRSLDQTNRSLAAALDAAESNLYVRDVDLADRAWWDLQPDLSARYLDECPTPRRGWEWRYLKRRERPGLFQSVLPELPVLALGFVSGGDRMVAVDSHTASMREMTSGREVRLAPLALGALQLAALNSDGSRLAVVSAATPGAVLVVDPSRAGVPDTIPAGAPGVVEALAFAPDGRRIVLVVVRRDIVDPASKEKRSFQTEFEARLVVRDRETGRGTVSDPFESSGLPAAPLLTPDGAVLCPVFFGDVGFLYEKRPDSPRVERIWPRPGEEDNTGHGLVLDPDGRRVATWDDHHLLTVREVASGHVLATCRGHTERLRCATFSPDGTRLASGGDDRTVRVWDVERGEPLVVLRGHRSSVKALAFSPEASALLSVGGNVLIAWDATTGSEARVVRESGRYHLADLAIAQGDRIAVISGHRLSWRAGATSHAEGDPQEAIEGDAVASSTRGDVLAAGIGEGLIALIDASGQRVGELQGHRSRVTSLAFSRDGLRLASAAQDQTVRVWDVPGRREVRRWSAGAEGNEVSASAVALSPDGAWVAVGADGPDVIVRAVTTGAVVRRLEASGAPVRRLEFKPDGRDLLVVRSEGPGPARGEGGLTVWDVMTGTRRFGPVDHPGGITDAVFSPDGRRIASADRMGQARIWESATGRLMLTLRGPAGPIARLAFPPDGDRLFAAGGRYDPLARRSEETAELTSWDAPRSNE